MSWITSLLDIFEIIGLFGKTLTADHMYSRYRWEKFRQQGQTLFCQKKKRFCQNFIACFQYTENSVHFQKKGQLHRLNISEVIDSEKCGYFNPRKLLFENTLPDSTCSRVPNNGETYIAALLSQFSINLGEIQLENISLSHIRNLGTVS